jgi:hypothetical protein
MWTLGFHKGRHTLVTEPVNSEPADSNQLARLYAYYSLLSCTCISVLSFLCLVLHQSLLCRLQFMFVSSSSLPEISSHSDYLSPIIYAFVFLRLKSYHEVYLYVLCYFVIIDYPSTYFLRLISASLGLIHLFTVRFQVLTLESIRW